jgi:MFS family permease
MNIVGYFKKNKNLLFLVSSRFCISFATQMMAIVAGWQMFMISHSPFWLGLVGLSQFLPMLIFFVLTGRTADHYDRRKVIMTAESLFSFLALIMSIFTITGNMTK